MENIFTLDDIVSEIRCSIDGRISNSIIKNKLYRTIDLKDFYSSKEMKTIVKNFLKKYC